MRFCLISILASVAMLAIRTSAAADITVFTDKAEWESEVGEFTTIDFAGFPVGTPIDDQYADLGVVFTNDERAFGSGGGFQLFPNDGWGLWNNFAEPGIVAEFSQPMQWIAIDFPGTVAIDLYNGDSFLGSTGPLAFGGAGNFGGALSSSAFDRAIILPVTGEAVFIDDLHFGPPIPAPGSLGLLVIAGITRRRTR